MARRDEYESRVEKFLIPIMEENNFELVDVEYVKEAGTWYLRAYIDKEGGFTVDDCEMVSRRLSDWLDKEDFIDDSVVVIRHVNKEAIKACHAGERFSKKFIGKYFPFSSYGASFAKISFSIPPYRNRFSYRRSVAYKQYMKLVTFLFSFPVPPCFKSLFPSPSFQSFPTALKLFTK